MLKYRSSLGSFPTPEKKQQDIRLVIFQKKGWTTELTISSRKLIGVYLSFSTANNTRNSTIKYNIRLENISRLVDAKEGNANHLHHRSSFRSLNTGRNLEDMFQTILLPSASQFPCREQERNILSAGHWSCWTACRNSKNKDANSRISKLLPVYY